MHPAAYNYATKALASVGTAKKRILEIGAIDVNATEQGLSLRDFCASAKEYWGIDTQDGPGVDDAVSAADYDGKEAFDICLSTECMEHTERPLDVIECAYRALKPGGVLIITAASTNRQPHNCDGTAWAGVEYYANIEPGQLERWLEAGGWVDVSIEHNAVAGDVYAQATKPSAAASR